jgi:HSP20 family protein
MGMLYVFTRSAWRPGVDIYRTDHGLLLVIEVYGCRPGDLRLTVDRQRVTVAGVREPPVRAARWLRGEIAWGAFEREIPLPEPVDPQGARAEARDGLLLVHCPVGTMTSRTVRIAIQTTD